MCERDQLLDPHLADHASQLAPGPAGRGAEGRTAQHHGAGAPVPDIPEVAISCVHVCSTVEPL